VYSQAYRTREVGLSQKPGAFAQSDLVKIRMPLMCGKRRAARYRMCNEELFVPGYCPIHADTNDPLTMLDGYLKRVLRDLPKPIQSTLLRFEKFVWQYCVDNYEPLTWLMNYRQWVDERPYDLNRKKQLDAAYEATSGRFPPLNECHAVKAFGKTEVFDELKCPRMIHSRVDKVKVHFGPVFASIGKVVYQDKHFVKEISIPDRAKLILDLNVPGWKFFVSDYKAFESHMTPELMHICECALYRHMLRNFPDLADKIERVLTGVNDCRTQCGLKVSLPGRRMSGEMCTSLGNGFTNLMVVSFIMSEMHSKFEGYVEGDDGIFACEKLPTVEQFAELGFSIKISEIPNPCVGSFCGLIMGPDAQIVRDPRKFMMHFAFTHSFTGARQFMMDRLMRAKALSALYETPHCPIVGVMARRALLLTRGVRPKYVWDGYHKLPPDEFPIPEFSPTLRTRMLFQDKYGISIPIQLQAEAFINEGRADLVSLIVPPTSDQLWYAADYGPRFIT